MGSTRNKPHAATLKKHVGDAGRNIAKYRAMLGWQQWKLNAEAGISGVGMIESGERPNPRDPTLKKLAAVFTRELGFPVTLEMLRAPEQPTDSEIQASYREFLKDHPSAKSMSDEERVEVGKLKPPWGGLNVETWYFLLLAYRARKPEK